VTGPTPGPWHAYRADYQRLHDDDLLPIFVVGPGQFHTVAQVRAGSDDDDLPAQTEANAWLIAAAPALLAALKAMMAGSVFDGPHQFDDLTVPAGWSTIRMPTAEALDLARTAIAAAEAAL
jgi:hypothetical protein